MPYMDPMGLDFPSWIPWISWRSLESSSQRPFTGDFRRNGESASGWQLTSKGLRLNGWTLEAKKNFPKSLKGWTSGWEKAIPPPEKTMVAQEIRLPGNSAGALLGMVKKWPFGKVIWPPTIGNQKVTNWITWLRAFLGGYLGPGGGG